MPRPQRRHVLKEKRPAHRAGDADRKFKNMRTLPPSYHQGKPPAFADDPFFTIGTPDLCAWATGPCSVRIQTTEPAIARKLAKLPDCELVGYSVAGRWIRIFATPYTLPWVAKNVIEKFTLEFAKEFGGCFSENERSGGRQDERHTDGN